MVYSDAHADFAVSLSGRPSRVRGHARRESECEYLPNCSVDSRQYTASTLQTPRTVCSAIFVCAPTDDIQAHPLPSNTSHTTHCSRLPLQCPRSRALEPSECQHQSHRTWLTHCAAPLSYNQQHFRQMSRAPHPELVVHPRGSAGG